MALHLTNQDEYRTWILSIKKKIHSARSRVALSINQQLLELYWDLGREIHSKIETAEWGTKILDKISIDLKHEFPDLKGFSKRNLYAIKQWYVFYSDRFAIVPQSVAQIPWGHNRLIISKLKNIDSALFYVNETIQHGWTREILEVQIESKFIQQFSTPT